MASAWYVLQVYTNYEDKIEKLIRMLLDKGELDKEIVRQVKVPTEQVTEVKEGKKRTQTRKLYPGYVMLEMDLPEDNWKATCSKIKHLGGVNGFLNVLGDVMPRPLPAEEARGMLERAGDLKGERPVRIHQEFAKGDQVKITEGPFESFTGTIDEVNTEKNKLKVSVGIFGRNTQEKLEFMKYCPFDRKHTLHKETKIK
jgi:transcriptional antiterminator NusG